MAESPDSTAPQPLDYQPAATPAVTLRSFYSAVDAQIHANALVDAGITYNLLGANTNTLGPYNAFAQVDLQVQDRDRAEAEKVLQQLEAAAGKGEVDDELSEAMNDLNEPRCPQCASWRTYEVPAPWPGLMNFILGRVPEQPRMLECLKCHHRWISSSRDEIASE